MEIERKSKPAFPCPFKKTYSLYQRKNYDYNVQK